MLPTGSHYAFSGRGNLPSSGLDARMSRRLISTLVAAFALGGTPFLSRAQTIDTRPAGQEWEWLPFYSSGVFLGQTFTAPNATDVFLNSFTIYQVEVGTGQPTTYTASLSTWNSGTLTTGSQIWSASGSNLSSSSFTDLPFAVNTPLSFGTQYMFSLFMNADNGFFFTGATPYADGAFYVQDGKTPNAAWIPFDSNYDDIEFSAQFSAQSVPEPGSMILFGTGLLALAGVAIRSRTSVV